MKLCVILPSFLLAASLAGPAFADDPAPCVPEPGGKCLTKDQFESVKKALVELDAIHKSPLTVTTSDSVAIVSDWDGRTYVNGGATKPLRFKVKIGDTVDRDVDVVLTSTVFYRPKPPDPMFRLRIRAQAGILAPELIRTVGGDKQSFWDCWMSFDFFHLGVVNLAVNAGVRSASAGPGLDLTRNFGITGGYAFTYDGFRSSVFAATYFSFN